MGKYFRQGICIWDLGGLLSGGLFFGGGGVGGLLLEFYGLFYTIFVFKANNNRALHQENLQNAIHHSQFVGKACITEINVK